MASVWLGLPNRNSARGGKLWAGMATNGVILGEGDRVIADGTYGHGPCYTYARGVIMFGEPGHQ